MTSDSQTAKTVFSYLKCFPSIMATHIKKAAISRAKFELFRNMARLKTNHIHCLENLQAVSGGSRGKYYPGYRPIRRTLHDIRACIHLRN